MRYWYGYTGESLILGHGRTIRQVMPHSREFERLLTVAKEHYVAVRSRSSVTAETFTAALLAPLSVQELGTASPPATPFSSAGQVLRLFEDVSIEQVAVNLFNGRMASAYASESDANAIAARVAQAFNDGDLLFLPRDATRLHTQEILNTLPGALVFLLSRSQAERKAFAGYLRRGTLPVVSSSAMANIAKSRTVLRTWEREARLEKERHHHEKCC